LATLNIALVLIATIGGLSSVFAALDLTQIRAWNRSSVYIAFLALAGLLLALQRLRVLSSRTGVRFLAAAAIACVAILDQAHGFRAREAGVHEAFSADGTYIRSLEREYGCRRVYQLPYEYWPEPAARSDPYGQGKLYLQSREIHWSYGAMKGRDADLWLRMMSKLPIRAQMMRVREAGFCGVLLNRGVDFRDAVAVESGVREAASGPPLTSADSHWIFYPVTPSGSTPASVAALSSSGLTLRANDEFVYTQAGTKTPDQRITSNGRAGALMYGPYLPLKKGRYRARLFGQGEPVAAATLDAVAKRGTLVLGESSFMPSPTSATNGVLAELDFEVPDDVGDLEIRVLVPAGARVSIAGYDVERQNDKLP
jgi:phosphoglycerol transferase